MKYEEAFSLYKLNGLEADDLVSLADEWLSGGVYTESLDELYMQKKPIMADAGPLFERAMRELGVKEPSVIEAANYIVQITLQKIVEEKIDPVEGATFLYLEVYDEITDKFPDRDFMGDNLNLEYIFCWLREIWDCRDGSIILYHTDLPRPEAEAKFMEHLIEEAKKWLNIAT